MSLANLDMGKKIKQWYFIAKNDPAAAAQVRVMLLGIIACFTIYYGANTLIIAPKNKALGIKQAQLAEVMANATALVPAGLAPAIEQLTRQKQDLNDRIATLKVKKRFLQEEWRLISDPDRFTNIIFTSFPTAPVNIKKNLKQMSLAKERTRDGFAIQPVNLAGIASFKDFLAYLQYLESRPEAGPVDELKLENLPITPGETRAKIRFNVLLSRIKFQEGT